MYFPFSEKSVKLIPAALTQRGPHPSDLIAQAGLLAAEPALWLKATVTAPLSSSECVVLPRAACWSLS